jgi:hypothetical protein
VSTLEERTIPTLLKSIGVGIILSSTIRLRNYLPWQKVLKNTMGSSLRIHSSKGQMVSSDCCYYDRARLPTTQSSNGHHDVGALLLLGVQVIASKSRRPSLPDRSCLSLTQCSNGYESLAHCYCEFEAPWPIVEVSLRICHRWCR